MQKDFFKIRSSQTKLLYKSAQHSAFTDLCEYHGRLICSFREATDHMSIDGHIRLLNCDQQGNVLSVSRLHLAGCDIRDPKLSIMPDGKLLLNAYVRCYDKTGSWTHSQSICWFSTDGTSWSSEHWYGDKNWWVWRLRWHLGKAYGLAYNRTQEALKLCSGNPLRTMDIQTSPIMSKQQHQLGYPNESDICFDHKGNALALVRRDADTFSAQLGISNGQFRRWQWFDLGVYLGGPVMLQWDDQRLVICARVLVKRQFKTALLTLDTTSKKLTLVEILPSAGDSSYAGMIRQGNQLVISYYSSHVDDQTNIFIHIVDIQA